MISPLPQRILGLKLKPQEGHCSLSATLEAQVEWCAYIDVGKTPIYLKLKVNPWPAVVTEADILEFERSLIYVIHSRTAKVI